MQRYTVELAASVSFIVLAETQDFCFGVCVMEYSVNNIGIHLCVLIRRSRGALLVMCRLS